MRWFRANRRFGGRLALFALALQFYLAFGHIHREDIFGPPDAMAFSAAAMTPATDHARPLDFPSKHTDDYCAICAAMVFLASSFVPQLPVLPLPVVAIPIERRVARVVSLVIVPQRTPFRSRAPPLV
ncbi:MAG TPA: hypothetical protein VGJ20_28185 [Xanthobacteraceae bacterium]|jgi:hypothetical protein